MSIYFITSLIADKNNKPKCFGFYRNYYDALNAIKTNRGNLHECLFQYCVLEEFEEGVNVVSKNEWWFEYKDNWVECDKPEIFRGLINFAIG